ncbi:ABC transporter permease [Streptomyces sp. NPDC001568]|uniref:ABC transporter permease n=1 Tax=Streptomyces sp. NPDC001568 TaxID=3364588 RepID=UPI0036CD3892
MSTLTQDPTIRGRKPSGPRALRGLAWLMVHQHRAALLCCLALTAIGAALIIYQRGAMLDDLHAAGWPGKAGDSLPQDLTNRISNDLNSAGATLGFVPVLLGAFLGAPLIAADYENGTGRLVATQSVSRLQWLLAKVSFALIVVTVPAAVLSLLYGWWWRSLGPLAPNDWLSGALFDTTGPVLVATALCTTSLGMAIGTVVRRVTPAMVATFLIAGIGLTVGAAQRDELATPHRLAWPLDGDTPAALNGGVEVDQWVGTASGKLYGWSTCAHDTAVEKCRSDLGIVNTVRDYFGRDQMVGMQWTAAAVLLTLTVLFLAVCVVRNRRGRL